MCNYLLPSFLNSPTQHCHIAHCTLHIAYRWFYFILFYFLHFIFSLILWLCSALLVLYSMRATTFQFLSFVCVPHLKSSVLLPFRYSSRFSLKNIMEKLQKFSTVFFFGVILFLFQWSAKIVSIFFSSFIHILLILVRNVLWISDFYFV